MINKKSPERARKLVLDFLNTNKENEFDIDHIVSQNEFLLIELDRLTHKFNRSELDKEKFIKYSLELTTILRLNNDKLSRF